MSDLSNVDSVTFIPNRNIAILQVADVLSGNPTIKSADQSFTKMTGFEDFSGKEITLYLYEKDILGLLRFYAENFDPGRDYQYNYRIVPKSGAPIWVLDNGTFYLDAQGRPCAQSILTDITFAEEKRRRLSESERRLRMGIHSSKICIFEVDLLRQLYTSFENAEAIFGVSGQKILRDVQAFSALGQEEYRKAASHYFSHPEDEATIAEAFQNIYRGAPATYNARMKAGNSEFVWCRVVVTPVTEDGVPVKMIGVIMDINAMILESNQLKKDVQRDLFTGFYNKNYTQRLIDDEIAKFWDRKQALILLDIDNLKKINDTRGHFTGDEIILEISKNIKSIFITDVILGRFGGDEFIIFIKDAGDKAAIYSQIGELLRAGTDSDITLSAGIAFAPDDGKSFTELFQNADTALYQAKKGKNTWMVYDENMRGR